MAREDVLISTDWLAARLDDPRLRIVDCSWYVPEMQRSGRAEFETRHIPGAVYFDLDAVSARDTTVVNMLPPPAEFARAMGELGVDQNTQVVVYDANYVSARLWWMLRCMGHDKVLILDGGLARWEAEGRPLASGASQVAARKFTPRPRADWLADWHVVLDNIGSRAAQLVDARTAARFAGSQPTGYPGIANGRIPGSINLPWSVFYAADRRFVGTDELRRRFTEAGVDIQQPVIATCGSGVTACLIGLALYRLGRDEWRVYDGSWHEWAQRPELPREA